MVQIGNPIYDTVFKYLLEDNKVAKIFLSAIIGKDIIKLDFNPTEIKSDVYNTLTVFHIDFKATIKETNGDLTVVLIELQKAKLEADLIRFRSYLGEQYRDLTNVETKTNKHGKTQRIPIPLITIYFLGYTLNNISTPVLYVKRQYLDGLTKKTLDTKHIFIESLTHDSIIIQIPNLKKGRQTHLEQLLSIFDQDNLGEDIHILNVNEDDFCEKHKIIIRRLQQAIATTKVRKSMRVEDTYIEELKDYERLIANKNKEIQSRDKEIQSRDKEIQSKDKEIQSREEEIQSKTQNILNSAKIMKENGLDSTIIRKATGLSIEKINNL